MPKIFNGINVRYIDTYIHTYKNLFKHAGLNNSELISMRGVIWRKYTVQINIKIQKQRKKNYIYSRQQDEPILSVCLINSSLKRT